RRGADRHRARAGRRGPLAGVAGPVAAGAPDCRRPRDSGHALGARPRAAARAAGRRRVHRGARRGSKARARAMTRAYLDATAIAKLVCRAPESAALMTFLEDAQEITTSAVSEVEVTRALAPSGFSPADTTATLQSFIVVAVDAEIGR